MFRLRLPPIAQASACDGIPDDRRCNCIRSIFVLVSLNAHYPNICPCLASSRYLPLYMHTVHIFVLVLYYIMYCIATLHTYFFVYLRTTQTFIPFYAHQPNLPNSQIFVLYCHTTQIFVRILAHHTHYMCPFLYAFHPKLPCVGSVTIDKHFGVI